MSCSNVNDSDALYRRQCDEGKGIWKKGGWDSFQMMTQKKTELRAKNSQAAVCPIASQAIKVGANQWTLAHKHIHTLLFTFVYVCRMYEISSLGQIYYFFECRKWNCVVFFVSHSLSYLGIRWELWRKALLTITVHLNGPIMAGENQNKPNENAQKRNAIKTMTHTLVAVITVAAAAHL